MRLAANRLGTSSAVGGLDTLFTDWNAQTCSIPEEAGNVHHRLVQITKSTPLYSYENLTSLPFNTSNIYVVAPLDMEWYRWSGFTGQGVYVILNKASMTSLDLLEGSSESGTKVQGL